MACADEHGEVTVIDLQKGEVLRAFRVRNSASDFLGFTLDGQQLVTAAVLPDGRQAITLWRVSTGERVRSLLGGSGRIDNAAIHSLTGELLVCGPNTRAWSLAGKPASWELQARGNMPVFCGSDDLIFTPPGVYQLEPGGNAPMLKNLQDSLMHPIAGSFQVSFDGKVAAVKYRALDNSEHVIILRNPGGHPEVAGDLKVRVDPDIMRLTSGGDRMVLWKGYDASDVVNTATGESAGKLVASGIKVCRDLGWLAGGKEVVGVMTAVAERGMAGSEERIIVWDAATGKVLRSTTHRTAMDPPCGGVRWRAFCRGGHRQDGARPGCRNAGRAPGVPSAR